MEEIIVNGKPYVPKGSKLAEETNGMKYCIIRTYSAGVHAGYVKERDGKEVTLVNSRRLWRWAGAFTLSEIAINGINKPDECKFACVLPEITLTEAIEIIPCTEKSKKSIESVADYNVNK